jgi:hypothetical protein
MLRKALHERIGRNGVAGNDILSMEFANIFINLFVEITIVPKDCRQKANTVCPQQKISSGPSRRRLNSSAKPPMILFDADVLRIVLMQGRSRIHSPSCVLS